jgi:protease-4
MNSMVNTIGVVAGTATAMVAIGGLAQTAHAQDTRPKVAYLEIEGALPERGAPMGMLFGKPQPTVRSVIETIDTASEDERYQVLVVRLKDAELSLTHAEEIGAAIKRFDAVGERRTFVFSEGFGTMDLVLASFADQVLAQKGTGVMLPGMLMEEMFLADTLSWAGLRADFVQVGDYKGASEMMSRSSPSPQWDLNINQLLDSMYENLRAPLLARPGMNNERLDEAMKRLWMGDANDAVAAGLIDQAIDLPELSATVAEGRSESLSWSRNLLDSGESELDMSNPFALLQQLSAPPDTSVDDETIAVVHINGAIVDGDSTGGGILGGGGSVGSRTIRKALEEIRKEDMIKGVVLRIDSPGGSATASEVIWQGVRRLAEEKPVWVSVGSMAASGGYYIAVAGDRIYVNPSSIVGSIGVVGGKISMEGLYEMGQVKVVTRSRGPRGNMFGSASGWDDAQKAEVRAKMTQTYDLFTSRVAAGRKGIDLSKTAEGRLFTGNNAIGLGMADEIGGIDQAIGALAQSLSLDEFEVREYPAPQSFGEAIEDALGGFVQAPGVASQAGIAGPGLVPALGRQVLGERAWRQIAPSWQAFMLMREEPVLLTSPTVLFVK